MGAARVPCAWRALSVRSPPAHRPPIPCYEPAGTGRPGLGPAQPHSSLRHGRPPLSLFLPRQSGDRWARPCPSRCLGCQAPGACAGWAQAGVPSLPASARSSQEPRGVCCALHEGCEAEHLEFPSTTRPCCPGHRKQGGGPERHEAQLLPWLSPQGAEGPHLPEGQGDSEALQRAV